MALKMPGPSLRPSGVYQLNVRVPADLVKVVAGTPISLPVGAELAVVRASDKVMLSLRTKDPKVARARFAAAFASLQAHWEAVRVGPKPLGHKQVVALAGEVYREFFDRREEEFDLDRIAAADARHERAVRELMQTEEGTNIMSREEAETLVVWLEPRGAEMLAWARRGDVDSPYLPDVVHYRPAMEVLFGRQADAVCARHGVGLDASSRLKLLTHIGNAVVLGGDRLAKLADGDYSPDPNLACYPPVDQGGRVTVANLFERWRASKADKVEASTIRRYTPSLNSLAAFLPDKDVRRIEQDDLWSWAEHRRDVDGIAPGTVNRNDLVAAASIFTFATTRDGKRLRLDNPVAGVRLELPKIRRVRPPFFRPAEVKAILTLARSVEISRAYPKASASRRWVPWICAYSGARVQEPCWLEKKHVRQDEETGIWVMDFVQTKTGNARTVPLHEALIEEGFLVFVEAAPDGLLFVGDRTPKKENEARTIQEQRASQIAEWVQHHVGLEEGVDPNHGWRHTFITRATGRMEERIQHAICGHNEKRDVADGYFTATISEMKAGLDRFSAYAL